MGTSVVGSTVIGAEVGTFVGSRVVGTIIVVGDSVGLAAVVVGANVVVGVRGVDDDDVGC